ncbi:MAG: CGNR zinc finger domain-containing protein [Chloroflexota bacterium]|nr:MAG: CGNR zinc finger domain-containing protein [Chloroflexota bacterium]
MQCVTMPSHLTLTSTPTPLHTYIKEKSFSCENPDCRWVYYDESANQNRRWCEDSCANLMRVRRFRARHQGSNR